MAPLARCLLPGWEGPLTLLKDPSLALGNHAQHQSQSYGPKYCECALFCLDLVEDSVCACVCVCVCALSPHLLLQIQKIFLEWLNCVLVLKGSS